MLCIPEQSIGSGWLGMYLWDTCVIKLFHVSYLTYHPATLCMSDTDCFTCRYAYMEYATETDAAEAVKKYQDVELEGHRLYVIKAMMERMNSFGEMLFIIAHLLCRHYYVTFKICIVLSSVL